MADLTWILDSEKASYFGNSGISSGYILPKNDVGPEPKVLAGIRLWIILRGHEDRLFQLVKIKKVERIIDGYYSGDYLVSSEITESVKLVLGYTDTAKYSTSGTRSLKLGITEISPDLSESFAALVKSSVQTKLLSPDKISLAKIDFQLLPHNSYRLAQSALRAVVSHLTLEQVWASGSGDKLGAFSNFAYALLYEKTGIKPPSSLVDALKAFDPISVIFAEMKLALENEDGGVTNLGHSCVDTEFSEIEPEKIYAREFVSANSKLRGLEEALNKTEHAEKVHQAMLKDISEFLIGNKITPYESGSIDLMYRSVDKLNIFEIKSANADNILSQAAKGAFQLACYLNELSKDYDKLDARLVIHDTESRELQNYAIAALSRLNVQVLVYDPSKPWPSRVQGMQL